MTVKKTDSTTKTRASRRAAPPCWPLPPEWDTLIPPQAVEIICGTDDQYRTTFSRPQWNAAWLRGLEAYVRSIVRDELSKANKEHTNE